MLSMLYEYVVVCRFMFQPLTLVSIYYSVVRLHIKKQGVFYSLKNRKTEH